MLDSHNTLVLVRSYVLYVFICVYMRLYVFICVYMCYMCLYVLYVLYVLYAASFHVVVENYKLYM